MKSFKIYRGYRKGEPNKPCWKIAAPQRPNRDGDSAPSGDLGQGRDRTRVLELRLNGVLERISGLELKLDDYAANALRFRPDAVWTLEEAARELRMSPRRLLDRIGAGELKTLPRASGDGKKRGKRGDAIRILYEEIQRFKGYSR